MAGGLLQIVSAGNADIFLTSSPQITFFKIVFLRHTNFAIETLEEFFDGDANFGETVVCTLSKSGDLIHKMYLKIDLPEVFLQYAPNSQLANVSLTNLTTALTEATTLYNNYKHYMKNVFVLWRNIYKELNSLAGNYETVNTVIANFKKSDNWIDYIKYNSLFTNVEEKLTGNIINLDIISVYEISYKESYKTSMYSLSKNAEFKQVLLNYMLLFKEQATLYNQQLYENILSLQNKLNVEKGINYKFSWVHRIGFALVDYINITIGGQIIDRLTYDLLNIWHELVSKVDTLNILDKMIGNVPELFDYSTTRKPYYSLYIPLPFWFSKNPETSLPALSLRYHDIQVTLRLRELEQCCHFEVIKRSLPDEININDLVRLANVSLYVDYVYLEQEEREKYGIRNIEYLIEQNQILTVSNINSKKINHVLSFTNPVKELFWVLQEANTLQKFKEWHRYDFIRLYEILSIQNNGANKAQIVLTFPQVKINDKIIIKHTKYYNGVYKVTNISDMGIDIDVQYIGNDSGVVEIVNNYHNENTISDAVLVFNGVQRISLRDSRYYNLVVPYQHHTSIPPPGIYNICFALHPEVWQPSGSCNMSILSSNELFLTLDPLLYERITNNNDNILLKVFARSLNILKISQGMASIEFGI